MIVCAWCESVLKHDASTVVSHGICQECRDIFLEGAGSVPAGELLEGFEFPLLLVNSNVELIEANHELRSLVKKEVAEIKGRLGGEIFGCIHSTEPGGCGKTNACPTCLLRNSVATTYYTGEPLTDVDSYHTFLTNGGLRTVQFRISTAAFLDSVLLKMVVVRELDRNTGGKAQTPKRLHGNRPAQVH